MRILVVGSSGFLGRHIAAALARDGHDVIEALRPAADLERDDAAAWRTRLAGMDVVVNAAGIIRESHPGAFEAIHARGPGELFAACAELGVKVIHISALGADEEAATAFHRSKKHGDDRLLALDVDAAVLQPSLVFGADGASTRAFLALATLPWTFVPGDGAQRIQPIHVDDVAAAVCALVRKGEFRRKRIALVGPRPISFAEYLGELRAGLGLAPGRVVRIPRAPLRFFAADLLSMLDRGNVAPPSAVSSLLGRAPRDPRLFIAGGQRAAMAALARTAWLAPMLRVAIALVWIVTGVLSLGVFPVERSLDLLARVGLTGAAAQAALYGAAALDLAIGIATLVMRRRRAVWIAQAALILGYTAIITVFLPEQWLHPFGPVLKNVPMLAAIAACAVLEER